MCRGSVWGIRGARWGVIKWWPDDTGRRVVQVGGKVWRAPFLIDTYRDIKEIMLNHLTSSTCQEFRWLVDSWLRVPVLVVYSRASTCVLIASTQESTAQWSSYELTLISYLWWYLELYLKYEEGYNENHLSFRACCLLLHCKSHRNCRQRVKRNWKWKEQCVPSQ